MTVSLVKIRSELFPRLYDAFLRDDDPLSDEQTWRSIWDYQWETNEDYCGYALMDDDTVVGMIGLVFSKRWIDGRWSKFCNLHTWWVREDHRGRSLTLLRPALKLTDYTLTHFTPCDKVRAISTRLGFQELNSQLRILLPVPGSRRSVPRAEFFTDAQRIRPLLSEPDLALLADHAPYGCHHLLVRQGDRDCYIIYSLVVRHRMTYCHIHYISEHGVYAAHELEIRNVLLSRHPARFVAVDCRLTQDIHFRYSFPFWAPAHGLFKSDQLSPHQVDHLYSDVVFLSLTTLPDMTHELTKMASRYAIWNR